MEAKYGPVVRVYVWDSVRQQHELEWGAPVIEGGTVNFAAILDLITSEI